MFAKLFTSKGFCAIDPVDNPVDQHGGHLPGVSATLETVLVASANNKIISIKTTT
ncbi:MAG: hypothetical protein ACO3F9_08270 [Burkholderiales bacterium]